jgi:hypothetical protein
VVKFRDQVGRFALGSRQAVLGKTFLPLERDRHTLARTALCRTTRVPLVPRCANGNES